MQRWRATRASMGFGGEWYHMVPLFFSLYGETSRPRYHSLENWSVKLRGLGQSPSGYSSVPGFIQPSGWSSSDEVVSGQCSAMKPSGSSRLSLWERVRLTIRDGAAKTPSRCGYFSVTVRL